MAEAREAVRREAQRLAGVTEAAGVFFYTANDCFDGVALSVPAREFKNIKDDAPLVLTELRLNSVTHQVEIVSVHPLTLAFCKTPTGRAAASFLGSKNAYEVLIPKLPLYVPVARAEDAMEIDTNPLACTCDRRYSAQWQLLHPLAVRAYLNQQFTTDDTELVAQRVCLYAHEALDLLEHRVLLLSRRADPVQTMTALRVLQQEHYSKCWKTLGGTEARASTAAVFLALTARPREGVVMPARVKDEPCATFDEEVLRAGNVYCPWSTAVLAADDLLKQHFLGDPELGMHRCTGCVSQLVAAVQGVLTACSDTVPWIVSVFGSPTQPWAMRVPNTSLFALRSALAWRLPTMAEYRENAADYQPLADVSALLYGAVPHIGKRMGVEALFAAYTLYTSPDTPGETLAALARLQMHADVKRLCEAWDKHASLCETSTASIAACRAETPVPAALTEVRAAHPITLNISATQRASPTGSTAEEATAWHSALKQRQGTIASRVGDIEDLLLNDTLPPCLACSLTATRTAAHADNVERRTLALWMRDMGAAPDAAARIVLGENAEDARLREFVAQSEYAARQAETTSLDCKAIMNPMKVGGYGASIRCPVRAEHLGASDAGQKLTENATIGAIRWRCTRKLKGFVENETTRFAVWHPLDYITLQLDALQLKREK